MLTKTLGMLAVLAFGLSVTGCQHTRIAGIDCAALIGPTLRGDVESAPLPLDNTVGEWVSFADAQTGRLIDANGRRRAVVEGVDLCQAQQARIERPWWRLF